MKIKKIKCPLCELGNLNEKRGDFMVKLKNQIKKLRVKNLKWKECDVCGEKIFDYNTVEKINRIIKKKLDPKMIIKKKFKEKLLKAKKLRERIGDPISLGKSIIEIPEEEAERKLSNFKGYKYISKKL